MKKERQELKSIITYLFSNITALDRKRKYMRLKLVQPLICLTATIGLALSLPIQSKAHKPCLYEMVVENPGLLSEREDEIRQQKASPDLELVRNRIIDDLLAPATDKTEIEQFMKSLQPNGTWPDINYQDVWRTGFQHSQHLANMLEMSWAYKKPDSGFYQNPELKKAVSSALDFWLAHDFICDNWWWNEMGTPNHMINILLVMDADLTVNQPTEGARIANRANLEASGARPGGDLIQIAAMLGKQGLFARDEEVLEKVVKVMAEEINTTTGRGLKPDLSFHHRTDNVISTLSYGTGYASSFAYWPVKTAGTKFKLPEEALQLLVDYYLDGISESMVYGRYPDPGAKNRGITRKGALNPVSPALVQNLLQASSYRRGELEELVKVQKGEKEPAFTSNRFFWHSEYFTHQRPKYFASVRMHSGRGNNMEQPHNEEGLKDHHYGDGSNFISQNGKEYAGIYPVWDWQKIPGTTVVQKAEVPHWMELAKKGRTDFVGGISDGEYGAAAFDFVSVHDPLKARKSWFFFDQEYFCLEAGITAEAADPVATTLNQCLLNQEVVVKQNNRHVAVQKGEHTLGRVAWDSHDGVAYLFPSPAAVRISNNTANGNWREINHQAWATEEEVQETEEEVQEEVFSLWLDHGRKPQNASYAYVVVPGLAAPDIDQYHKKSPLTILANTPEVQAVVHQGLGISQVVFYQAGEIRITKNLALEAHSPCMVMLKTNGKTIHEIAVSDPSRKLNKLHLEVTAPVEGSGSSWSAAWDKKIKTSLIQLDLPQEGYAGMSVVLETGLSKPKAGI